MKILHITEAYGGGVFTSVNQLVNGQAAAGHSVVLAVAPRSEAPPDWRTRISADVSVRKLDLTREISLSNDLRGILQIRKLIQELSPDAIHLHSSKAGFAGRVAAFLTGHSHKTFYSPRAFAFLAPGLSSKKRKLYFALEKLGAFFGGTVVACSNDELVEAQKMRLKSVLVNNAIDMAVLKEQVALVQKQPSAVVRVMTAGRVCSAKRPQLFVDIAEELKKRQLPVEFTWLGGGDKFPATEAVKCSGWLPRGQVLRELKEKADIYLQTSSYEGMPLSVLEAQGLGIPVVVADAVGNRSAVSNGISGFVVAPVVRDFADKLEKLILDSPLRERMGNDALRWAQQEFDTPLMLSRYERLFATGAVDGGAQ